MQHLLARLSTASAVLIGRPWVFVANCLIILVWALCGPLFGFSDTWQLVVNTGTTVFTYLMMFLLQATQNRNDRAMHAKLDEILRALAEASNDLMGLEDRDERDISEAQAATRARGLPDEPSCPIVR